MHINPNKGILQNIKASRDICPYLLIGKDNLTDVWPCYGVGHALKTINRLLLNGHHRNRLHVIRTNKGINETINVKW